MCLISRAVVAFALALTVAVAVPAAAAHAAAPSAAPAAAPAPIELKPLIVVRNIKVLRTAGASKADLYGTVKIDDVGGTSSSTVFSRGEYDSVPLEFGSDAPLASNGLSAAHVSISVDLWDHWSPVFMPDTHIAQGSLDTVSAHAGLNDYTFYGPGKASVQITYSKQTSWQKTTIDSVVLNDSTNDPASIYGTMSASATYVDQATRKSAMSFPFFDQDASEPWAIKPFQEIWSQSPPLVLYTDLRAVTVTADIWAHHFWFSDDHVASGSITIAVTRSATPQRSSKQIGGITVHYTTVRETESPEAAGVTTYTNTATAAETVGYWTPERLRDAAADDDYEVTSANERSRVAITPAHDSAVGKVFFTRSGRNDWCSGVTVDSHDGNLVETAAHCLKREGAVATNVVFIPGYDGLADNPAPYGVWPYVTSSLLNGWVIGSDTRFDQAIIHVPSDSQDHSLSYRASFHFIIFDQSPTQSIAIARAYTMTPQAHEGQLYECAGSTDDQQGRSRMLCNMRKGSSGGPMMICYPLAPMFEAVYAVISLGNRTVPDIRAFPHSNLLRDLMMEVEYGI